MNNLIYNIPNDWYNFNQNDFQQFNNTYLSNNNDLETPEKGLEKGNLFKYLYDPYKNYQYRSLNPNNDFEKLLYNILKYKFAMNDLNLYLDNYPNNMKMINLYNQYLSEEKKLCEEYEKSYGPITTDSRFVGDNNFKWVKSPWPWEGTK